jgi:hypothetical protein
MGRLRMRSRTLVGVACLDRVAWRAGSRSAFRRRGGYAHCYGELLSAKRHWTQDAQISKKTLSFWTTIQNCLFASPYDGDWDSYVNDFATRSMWSFQRWMVGRERIRHW